MPLKIKHNRANNTHENEQFRRIAFSLKLLFEQQNWSGILIGNPYNELYSRFRADAILLYNYGLFIIDFKEYQGTIKLPKKKSDFEILQWYVESDEDKSRILIKAGSKFINPFRQLNSYRNAFKEIVQNELLLRNIINENVTCAINIFSGPINIENSIPKEIPFYKITQESELGNVLYVNSSENSYNEEIATHLSRIFHAEDWQESIKMPALDSLTKRTVKINENVEQEISKFLEYESNALLILESMDANERANWLDYINEQSFNFKIPQLEIWAHSSRICRKLTNKIGIEFHSIYNSIYGGSSNLTTNNELESDDDSYIEQSQEVIPIRNDEGVLNTSALIVLFEAHLITRSKHESELLRFGSGRLLEDLFNFINIEKTKRKLICIGDPYSLTYGKKEDSAINSLLLSELYSGKIFYYKSEPTSNSSSGKETLRKELAKRIDNKQFNELEYLWELNDLLEIKDNEKAIVLKNWFEKPLENEPNNVVMTFSNPKANEINQWIKRNCLKNGNEINKNDLLILNNNVNIVAESDISSPNRLLNGMYLLVENVLEQYSEYNDLKQPVTLNFTKLKVKCLSITNKPTFDIWILDNYFKSEKNLSKEEEIAIRVFVKQCLNSELKKQPFVRSVHYNYFKSSDEFIALNQDEKNAIDLLIENYSLKKEKKHKVHTTKNARVMLEKFNTRHKQDLFNFLIKTDSKINAAYVRFGWVLTVHKCVGSNFYNGILIANQGENRGVNNEDYFSWLYTGVSCISDTLFVAAPQEINPLMEIHFEDKSQNTFISNSNSKQYLYFQDYQIDNKYKNIIPEELNENIKGVIGELSKKLENINYLIDYVLQKSQYLTKVSYNLNSDNKKKIVIAINNKGEKEKWGVSSIRIEKSDDEIKSEINNYIESLYINSENNDISTSLRFPEDFRKKIYNHWEKILNQKEYQLELIAQHQNHDVFLVKSNNKVVSQFKVWYTNNGFFTQFIVEKSIDNFGENLNNWLLKWKIKGD